MEIYIGYSQDIINRILNQHCSGNVRRSILRKHVARRITGQNVVPNDPQLENRVSNYIRFGKWRYVICESPAEAKDFKKYVIHHHEPPTTLNVQDGQWNRENENRYEELFEELNNGEKLTCENIGDEQTGSAGVCVFYHERKPPRSVRSSDRT